MINEVIKELKAVDERVKDLPTFMPKAIDILEGLKPLEVNDFKREAILNAYDSEESDLKVIKGVNSYNWSGNIDHHMQWYTVEVKGRRFMILSFHLYGDVRGNYSERVVLDFDERHDSEDFHEAIHFASKRGSVEVDGVAYDFEVTAMNDGVEVFTSDYGHYVFTIHPDGLTLEDITKAIKEKAGQ